MKKTVLCVFIIICLVMTMCISCQKGLDTGKMLAYQEGEPTFDIVFSLGEYKYPMHISLSQKNDSFVRDGKAVLSGGVLEGVCFEMKDGELKMLVGDLEYVISEKDSSPLYALFAAFAINEDDFVGVTGKEGIGELEARFNGKFNFMLTMNERDFAPIKVAAETDSGICTITFENTKTSEKAEEDGEHN